MTRRYHTHRQYLVTVTESDASKARELRSMLRNYRGQEVLPGMFRVVLSHPQHRAIVQSADQLGGAIRFSDPTTQPNPTLALA